MISISIGIFFASTSIIQGLYFTGNVYYFGVYGLYALFMALAAISSLIIYMIIGYKLQQKRKKILFTTNSTTTAAALGRISSSKDVNNKKKNLTRRAELKLSLISFLTFLVMFIKSLCFLIITLYPELTSVFLLMQIVSDLQSFSSSIFLILLSRPSRKAYFNLWHCAHYKD